MSNFSRLFFREWKNLFANKTIRNVLFIVPIIYLTLFGFLYSEKKVMNIPTVMVDADQTELSRELYRAFEADKTFKITSIVGTEDEAMRLVDKGEANIALLIPADLEKNVKSGRPAEVLTVIDGSNMMISNTAVRAASTVVKSVAAGATLKKMEAMGSWGEEGKNLFTGIDFRYRVLYNPTFSYMSFMVFGLTGTVLQQVLFLGIALSVAQQKEEGTWKETLASHSFFAITASKLLPYLLVGTFNVFLGFTLLLKGFEIPYYGSTLDLMLVATAFNLAVLAIGYAISFFSKDQLQATQIAMMIAVPSFMLSGFTWPLASMPTAVAAIGKSLPLTYFLDGVREILSKGHGLSYVAYDVGVLGFMTLLGLFLAYVTYLLQTRKNKEVVAETTTV
ncbi:ABC transporter permease [Brevibacillus gelatini]|uniref:ABC transporter permease n=1 Tax=Brevibacillus gelatini TaxID=1655277 RepID=A0A3M8B509_9BACL|nr:ABC transporter permease [Brevibacillus gelatini]RNB58372.1 ABC transporter permease [Brevibacillus gelatini]